jgi:hypothetical protein
MNYMRGACSTFWGREQVHIGFWRGNLSERHFGKPSRRWENNIKMDLQEVGWGHGID